jgi:hypothetical protein
LIVAGGLIAGVDGNKIVTGDNLKSNFVNENEKC